MDLMHTQSFDPGYLPGSPETSDNGQNDVDRVEAPSQANISNRVLVELENNLRFWIGRYIHDHPQQQLQAAISLLKEQGELLEANPAEMKAGQVETIKKLLELLNRANQELSLLRQEVFPATPKFINFRAMLEALIWEEFPANHPDPSFEVSLDLEALLQVYNDFEINQAGVNTEQNLILLFIREGFKNAYKHSAASHLAVQSELTFYSANGSDNRWTNFFGEESRAPGSGYYLRVAVRDDGKGFDWSHLRLTSLNSGPRSFYDFEARVRAIKGFSYLWSSPGQGTHWEIYIPISQMVVQELVNAKRSPEKEAQTFRLA